MDDKMQISNHQFNATLRKMTPGQVHYVCKLLGIPYEQFKETRNPKHQSVTLTYKFSVSSKVPYPDKVSIYFQLGRLERSWYRRKDGTKIYDADETELYQNVRLQLNGSFFDNSPGFNLDELLRYLDDRYTPQEVDVAFDDDTGVTTKADWYRVFGAWRSHCTGSLFLKGKATGEYDEGEILFYKIGSAKSRSSYATFYERSDGTLRLELKIRDTDTACDVINHLAARNAGIDTETEYRQHMIALLVSKIDIKTAESKAAVKRSQDSSRYVREPFFAAFLGSEPAKYSLKALKAARRANRQQSDMEKLVSNAKQLAGFLNGFFYRQCSALEKGLVLSTLRNLLEPNTQRLLQEMTSTP